MTGIALYPETTVVEITAPCCDKRLELKIKQTPSYMRFVVSVEEVKMLEES